MKNKNHKYSILYFIIFIVVICIVGITVPLFKSVSAWDGTSSSSFHSGTGSIDEPYVISTEEELSYFKDLLVDGVTFEGMYLSLVADLDITGATWSVGTSTFEGNFCGNGHTITSNSIFLNKIGLNGKVSLLNINCTTKIYSAILCKTNNGTIEGCVINGSVSSTGFVCNTNSGIIKNVGAIGTLTGSDMEAGGFAYSNTGTIENIFTSVAISLSKGGKYGSCDDDAIVYVNSGTINNAYYSKNSSTKGVYISETEMKTQTFVDILNNNNTSLYSKWVFNGEGFPAIIVDYKSEIQCNLSYSEEDILVYNDDILETEIVNTANGVSCDIYYTIDGSDPTTSNTAILYDGSMLQLSGSGIIKMAAYENGYYGIVREQRYVYLQGEGTEENPYLINDKNGLSVINLNPSAHYSVLANIELDESDFEVGGLFAGGWEPISNFTGVFNGNGYAISNLQGEQGGFVDKNNGIITSVRFLNTNLDDITCGDFGVVAKINNGTILSCYAEISSTVYMDSTSNYVGGIAGNNQSTIKYCSTVGKIEVHGASASYSWIQGVGGIAGSSVGTIENCYNRADISIYSSYITEYVYVAGITARGYANNCRSECSIYWSGSLDYDLYYGAFTADDLQGGANYCYGNVKFSYNSTNQRFHNDSSRYFCYYYTSEKKCLESSYQGLDFENNWVIIDGEPVPQGVMDADGNCYTKVSYSDTISPEGNHVGKSIYQNQYGVIVEESLSLSCTCDLNVFSFDDNYHYNLCSCGKKFNLVEHTVDNNVNPCESAFCIYCDKTYEPSIAHEKDANLKDCEDGQCIYCGIKIPAITSHVRDGEYEHGEIVNCVNCGKNVPGNDNHEYNEGVITVKPTCVEKGIKTYTCICGETYTEELGTLEHNYDKKITSANEELGIHNIYMCSCGDSYIVDVEDEPVLYIYKKNISYASEIYIMYAVSYEGIDVTTNPVKMLFYNSVQDEYTTQTASYVTSSQGSINIGGVSCQIFASNGLAAKQMTDDIYARAYVEVEGQTIYSDVVKYSVLEYYYEIKEAGTVSANILNLLEAMVNYGAAAQINFNYNTEKLANATYYKVSVENAVLPDGFTSGRFKVEEQVTLTAPEKEGYVFKNWTNANGDVISTEATYTLTVTQDETLTANYEEEVAVTPVTLTLTKEAAYDAAADTLNLPTTVTFDYNNETVTENVTWDTTSFVVNKIGKQKLYGTLSNDSYKVNELSIEIDVLPYTFSLDETNNTYSITNYYGNDSEITIPSKFNNTIITCIEDYAFENCSSLISVTLPSSVTSIGTSAFYYCSNLTNVYYEGEIENWCNILFNGLYSNPMSYASSFYMLTENDIYEEVTEVSIPESITSIGNYQFHGFDNLTSVEIHESVKSIGDFAFRKCLNLEKIVLPESVESIGESAFAESGLVDIKIYSKISYLSNYMFNECSSLVSVELPEGLVDLGSDAFFKCSKLETINIPSTVTRFGMRTFAYCSSLTSITIPSGVTGISQLPFYGCSCEILWNNPTIQYFDQTAFDGYEGESLTIPNTVTYISSFAFGACNNLADIYYQGTEEEWNNIEIGTDGNDALFNANIHFLEENKIEIFEENGTKYLYLGKYPQTVVSDESIISNLNNISTVNSLGYIEYDGNEYAKVTANPFDSDYTFTNGSSIIIGNVYYFKVEPIKWRILESNDGTYKLLSEMILDNTEFYPSNSTRTINGITIYANNYEYSNIRAWLNGYDGTSYNVNNYTNKGFIDIVFTESEKALINETLVDNSLSSTGDSKNPYVCNNTTDKIYLLSYSEVTNINYGFSSNWSDSDTAKFAKPSDYARSTGSWFLNDSSSEFYGNDYWRLRSPNDSSDVYIRIVNYCGYVSQGYINNYDGIRPALEITIK